MATYHRCYCKLGWAGSDCSINLVTNQVSPPPTNSSTPLPSPIPQPPAPPATRNVSKWFQVVQVTVDLEAPSLTAFYSRTQAFAAALASWAEVNASQVAILEASVIDGVSPPSSSLVPQDSSVSKGSVSELFQSQAPGGEVITTTRVHSVVSSEQWRSQGGGLEGNNMRRRSRGLMQWLVDSLLQRVGPSQGHVQPMGQPWGSKAKRSLKEEGEAAAGSSNTTQLPIPRQEPPFNETSMQQLIQVREARPPCFVYKVHDAHACHILSSGQPQPQLDMHNMLHPAGPGRDPPCFPHPDNVPHGEDE